MVCKLVILLYVLGGLKPVPGGLLAVVLIGLSRMQRCSSSLTAPVLLSSLLVLLPLLPRIGSILQLIAAHEAAVGLVTLLCLCRECWRQRHSEAGPGRAW